MSVYLTSAQIQKNYQVNLHADLTVANGVVISNQDVYHVISAANAYYNTQKALLQADEAFEERFSIPACDATEDMKESEEYKKLESLTELSETSLSTLQKMREKGYNLRKISK